MAETSGGGGGEAGGVPTGAAQIASAPKKSRWRKVVLGVLAVVVVVAAVWVTVAVVINTRRLRGNDIRPPAPPRSSNGGQPNIVFILTDDQDKLMGNLSDMPNIRQLLIEGGTTFDNFYVNYALCCPSRATILTGRCMHNTGVILNEGRSGGLATFKNNGLENETIASMLQGAGYRTALIGKYLNGYKIMRDIPPGWDRWFAFKEPPRYYNWTASSDGSRESYGESESDYSTDVIAAKTVDFIKESSSQPFFVYVSPYAVHTPAIPPVRHRGKFAGAKVPRTPSFNVDEESVRQKAWAVRKYPSYPPNLEQMFDFQHQMRQETLLAVDDLVGEIFDAVKSIGALDNTYFFLTSDNGFHLAHHRMGGGKQSPYEMDVNLPLLVRGPGVPQRGTVPHLVGNIDIYPTFAELAGVEIENKEDIDGVSFASLLTKNGPATVPLKEHRTAYLMEKLAIPNEKAVAAEMTQQKGWRTSSSMNVRAVALASVTQSVAEDSIGFHGEEFLDHYNDFRPLGLTSFYKTSDEAGTSDGLMGQSLFPNCINDGADLLPNASFTLYTCAAIYRKFSNGDFNSSQVMAGDNQAHKYVLAAGLSPLDYAIAIGFGFPTTYSAIRAHREGFDYKFIHFPLGYELYNLTADPDEVLNIFSTAAPSLVAALNATLEALTGCKGPTCHVYKGSPGDASV